jgi:Na+(H+)/acetate symporter ActP
MYGLIVIVAFIAIVVLIGLWARHRQRTVDDYYEHEFRDPPAHGWTIGNGPGGL